MKATGNAVAQLGGVLDFAGEDGFGPLTPEERAAALALVGAVEHPGRIFFVAGRLVQVVAMLAGDPLQEQDVRASEKLHEEVEDLFAREDASWLAALLAVAPLLLEAGLPTIVPAEAPTPEVSP